MLSEAIGAAGESAIRLWLRLFGRKVLRSEYPWLSNPSGPKGRIGEALYESIARAEGLTLREAPPGDGLLPDFEVLRGPEFDPAKVDPRIRDFYEHSSAYDLEAWSETSFMTRVFLWFLVTFISRRIDQLNFPLSGMDTSRGVSSRIIQLVEPGSGRVVHTGWLRKASGTGRVIYAGLYSTQAPGAYPGNCVKVSFPLPLGNSTVFLRPEAQDDGSLKLISAGKKFGDPGYYRVLDEGKETLRVRNLRSLHELFHLYVDEHGALRTDHSVRFMGLGVLKLHYKVTPAQPAP
jgi:hypothetical protein